MFVAIDVGSGYTQYQCEDGQRGAIASVVTPQEDLSGFGEEHAKAVVFKDADEQTIGFLVGDDAYAFGSPERRFNTLRDDWAGSYPWMALLYSVLDRVGANGEVVVSIGLPQALYAERRHEIEALLSRTHQFWAGETRYEIDLTAYTAPQATASLLYQLSKDPSILDEPTGVIDIGTYTTGLAVIEHARLVSRLSGGCTLGMSNLNQEVRDWIRAEYDVLLDPMRIPRVLVDRSFRCRGERIDLSAGIDACAERVERPLAEEIAKLWPQTGDMNVFVSGGGAPFFLSTIQRQIPHATVISEPFWAVVRGLYSWLVINKQAPALPKNKAETAGE